MIRSGLRYLLPLACAAGVLTGVLAPTAAHAERLYHADERGDVRAIEDELPGTPAPRDVRDDVASIGVSYGPTRLRITVTGVDITKHTGGVFALVDTPKRLAYTFVPIGYDEAPFFFSFPDDASRLACPGLVRRVDLAADVVLMSIPNLCLGNATKVRAGAQVFSGMRDRFYVDDALSPTLPETNGGVAYSRWLARG